MWSGNWQRRSVHRRGTAGPCNRAPKTFFCGGRPCSDKGKATVMSNDHGESDVTPTESKTTRTVGNFPRGSRETPAASASREADRSEKARCRKSDMHAAGESDSSIVPKKPTNNDGPMAFAESGGGKGTGQGEHWAVATGPDTVPETRVTRASRCASGGATIRCDAGCSFASKARAVCGSSARTDLREGRPARAGPIAIAVYEGDLQDIHVLVSRSLSASAISARYSPKARNQLAAPFAAWFNK